MSNIVKKLFSFLVWVLIWITCIYSAVLYAFMKESMFLQTLTENNFLMGRKRIIASFFLVFTLSAIKIIYFLFKDAHTNREKILNAFFPLLFFIFGFIFSNVGSIPEKPYGILLNIFKEHYSFGVCILFIAFAVVWTAIIFKTKFVLDRTSSQFPLINKYKNLISSVIALNLPFIIILNMIYFIIFSRFSDGLIGLTSIAILLYWSIYFIVFLIYKYKDFFALDEDAN